MTLARLWAFLAVALPALASLIASLSSVDLTYHLRAGREILDSGAIPTTDTWTFSAAGLPWFDQQWGAQVLLALVERVGGWSGLVLLRAVLIGWIFGAMYLIGRRRGLSERNAALLALGAFIVAAVALALRPQLLGMAIFAGVLLIVTERRRQPRALWLIPVIVAVWANVHGSFFLGPLVLGLAWLEDRHDRVAGADRTLLVAIASAAAACLTPFGPSVWAYAVGLSTNPEVTKRITEWQPTSLRDVPGILFFGSVLALVTLIARQRRAISWPTLAWLATFFLIGAYAIRGVAWWPLGAVPAVAAIPGPVVDDADERRSQPRALRRLNLLVAALVVLAAVAFLPVWRPVDPALHAPVGVVGNAPPGITAALRGLAVPGDRLFNPQPWGSWFEYALPNLPVVLDSRIEMFPAEVWDTYEATVAGRAGWERHLQDWGVTIVVSGPDDADGFQERLLGAGWTVAHRDEDGAILVRADR